MRSFLLITIILCVFSCKKSDQVDYALISGTVKNSTARSLTLAISDQRDFNPEHTFIKEIELGEDGFFSDTIYDSDGQYYFLKDADSRVEVCLRNGDSIVMNVDFSDLCESLNFSGKGSELNNYLALNRIILSTVLSQGKLDEVAFLAKMKEDKKRRIEQFKKIPRSYKQFRKSTELDIEYEYIRMIYLYQIIHRTFSRNAEFEVSESFPVCSYPLELEDFDYHNDEHFKLSYKYRGIVIFYYSNRAFQAIEEGILLTHRDALFDIVENEIESEVVRNYFLERFTLQFDPGKPEESKELYDRIMKAATDSALKAKLPALYKKKIHPQAEEN